MANWIRAILLSSAALHGCSGATLEGRAVGSPATSAQHDAAQPAIKVLQQGSFDRAELLAKEQIAADGVNPYPRLVRAIARYERSTLQLALDARTLMIGGIAGGGLNEKYLRQTFGDAEAELAGIETDLAVAAKRSGLALELCPACWEVDWNGSGRIDERDRLLLQIELDDDGHPIPDGDPRRKPTFRFDDGDVEWARAFVSFERATLDVLLAYDWTELGGLARGRHDLKDRIVVRLVDPGRIAQARQRLLEGLELSDASRRAYLAEKDDDREWVPNPTQRSHPLPLKVDPTLYDTWEAVVGDLRRLVQGDEGLVVEDVVALTEEHVKHPPRGTLDIGRMLSHPKDIVIDTRDLRRLAEADDTEGAMAALFGEYYVSAMKPSPLPHRLRRMKGEVDRHEEGLERKLRYLFWLN